MMYAMTGTGPEKKESLEGEGDLPDSLAKNGGPEGAVRGVIKGIRDGRVECVVAPLTREVVLTHLLNAPASFGLKGFDPEDLERGGLIGLDAVKRGLERSWFRRPDLKALCDQFVREMGISLPEGAATDSLFDSSVNKEFAYLEGYFGRIFKETASVFHKKIPHHY